MDLIKKHYEKILLGVMLAGLIGVLVFMLFYISSQASQMEQMRQSLSNPPVHALTNLDLTVEDGATTRLKAPYSLDLETTNKLLNPLQWQKDLNGNLIPLATKTGPRMVVVTNITPLFTTISFDSIATNEAATNYVVKVERQAAATAAKRAASRHYISAKDISAKEKPNDAFALIAVNGSPESPTGLVLKLVDTQEQVTITKDKPYRRVDGYSVDFRYDPERKAFHGKHVGDKISFGGVDYTVVDIGQNELILMDQTNQKKTSLPFNP